MDIIFKVTVNYINNKYIYIYTYEKNYILIIINKKNSIGNPFDVIINKIFYNFLLSISIFSIVDIYDLIL